MTLFFSLYTFCYPHTNFNKIHFRSEKKKKRTHHSISLRNTTLEDLWARSFLRPQTAMRSDLRPAERTGDGQPWALVPATMGDPVLPRVRGLTRNDRKALEERLRGRKTETEADIAIRLKRAEAEMATADKYDYIVVNDVVAKAADAICHIVEKET